MLRLQQDKESRNKAVELANERIQNGLPPTEESMKEFESFERLQLFHSESALERSAEQTALWGSVDAIRTACQPRPSAYIPEDIGIPKPYGMHAPFKPSETGSSMRHIKLPQPKQIEI